MNFAALLILIDQNVWTCCPIVRCPHSFVYSPHVLSVMSFIRPWSSCQPKRLKRANCQVAVSPKRGLSVPRRMPLKPCLVSNRLLDASMVLVALLKSNCVLISGLLLDVLIIKMCCKPYPELLYPFEGNHVV